MKRRHRHPRHRMHGYVTLDCRAGIHAGCGVCDCPCHKRKAVLIEIPERLRTTHAELAFTYGTEFAGRVIKMIAMVSAIKPGPFPPGRTWARRDAVTVGGETENRIRIWGEPHGAISRPFVTFRVDDIRSLSVADLASQVVSRVRGTHWLAEDVVA